MSDGASVFVSCSPDLAEKIWSRDSLGRLQWSIYLLDEVAEFAQMTSGWDFPPMAKPPRGHVV